MSNTFRTLDDLCRIPSSAPTTRETADHAELARLRQHIANLKLRPGHHVQFGTPSVSQISNYWNRDLADDLEALLSEIAALRGERDEQEATKLAAYDRLSVEINDRDKAERQRDEAVGLLTDLASWFVASPTNGTAWVIPSGDFGADDAVNAARTFLANQGADQ